MELVKIDKIESKRPEREAGMLTVTGAQGVGKTFLNMKDIVEYCKDKIHNKVRGRKCLIFDTNGEYTSSQFAKNGHPNFQIKTLAVADVAAWSNSDVAECRRIDARHLSIKQKKACMEHIVKVFEKGLLVMEDINTYILSVTHMEEVVGYLVNLRHRGVDLIISYQSLRPVEPRIWSNSRWIRMHYQADSIEDIKNKVTDPILFRIAQLVVNNRYLKGDKRFYVYIHNLDKKVKGKFSKKEFMDGCIQYLNSHKKYIKEYMDMHSVQRDEAIKGQTQFYISQYYGN